MGEMQEQLAKRQLKIAKRRGVVYIKDANGQVYRAVPVRASLQPVSQNRRNK